MKLSSLFGVDIYNLYQSTTVWVKGQNKRKKVSKYIGKLTERGIVLPP